MIITKEQAMQRLGIDDAKMFDTWVKEMGICAFPVNGKTAFDTYALAKHYDRFDKSKLSKRLRLTVTGQLKSDFEENMAKGAFGTGNPMMPGTLYLIHNAALGLHKIGITKDLNRRLNQLQNAGGIKLEVITFLTTSTLNVELLESFLHKYHNSDRRAGEWFSFTDHQVSLIVKLLKNIEAL